jgi:hypothetical protein
MERKTGSVLAGTHSLREKWHEGAAPERIAPEVHGASYPPGFAASHEFYRDEARAVDDCVVKGS